MSWATADTAIGTRPRMDLGQDSAHLREWQQRPLEGIYAVMFLDAIHYHVRRDGQIVKKTVYIAIGIDMDGWKDVLRMWVRENESAKFWATAVYHKVS